MKVFLPLLIVILFVACESKKAADNEKSGSDTINNASLANKEWSWPDPLDAITSVTKRMDRAKIH